MRSIIIAASICILGAICIPFITNKVKDSENDLAQSLLNQHHQNIVDTINSNIMSLNNYLIMGASGMTELYKLNAQLNNFQEVAQHSQLLLRFNIIRIFYFRIITNETELQNHIIFGKTLYNVSEFRPYDMIDGKIQYILPGDEIYPMLLMLFSIGTSPELSAVGSINAGPIYQMDDGDYSISNVITRVDGSNNIIFRNKFLSWISFILFDLDDFLNKTFAKAQENITEETSTIIEISDDDGIFYKSSNARKSDMSTIDIIEFKLRKWTVKTTLTQSQRNKFNKTSTIITIVCSFILIAVFSCVVSILATYARNKRKYYKQLQVIHNSNNIVIHEVRNIINSIYVIFQLKEYSRIDRTDLGIIQSGINNIINLLSNVLDYEKLLYGTYVPRLQAVNIVDSLRHFIDKYPFMDIDLTYNGGKLCYNMDYDKLQGLVLNGLNNSIKFSKDNYILVRFQRIDNNILIEVINWFDNIESNYDPDSIFTPFFITETDDKSIWKSTIKLLKCDELIKNMVSPYFNTTNLDTVVNHPAIATKVDAHINSTGLGLSISRLIAKSLNGECGLDLNKEEKFARYWFILPAYDISCTDFTDFTESTV